LAPKFGSTNSSEIWIEIQISLLFCATLRLYIEAMCVHFFNFDHLGITLQSSDLIWGTTFCASSLLLPPLIFSSFKLLSMAYMVVSLCLTHLLLEVASPIIFPPSPFHCHSSSRRKGLHWWRRPKAYKLHMELHHVVSRASSSRWCSFPSSIFLFSQFTLTPCSSSYSPCISSIVLWFGVVWSRFQKINRLNLRSTLVLAFLWFKFYRSTIESCFCVDFRIYHFSVIIFFCWTFRSKFSSKILIRKKNTKI